MNDTWYDMGLDADMDWMYNYKGKEREMMHTTFCEKMPEERESVDAYIKSISKPTGIEFDEEPSGDAISRQDAYKCLEIHGDYNTLNEVYERLEKLPSVKPQEPTDENLHREREQAYMQGYEDASKRFRQESCEDAISRQAAIDVIERWLKCPDYNKAERNIMRATESILYDLSSVNPQEKIETGCWIWQTEDIYRCSKCSEDIHVKEVMSVPQYKCCPMCGVKIVGYMVKIGNGSIAGRI